MSRRIRTGENSDVVIYTYLEVDLEPLQLKSEFESHFILWMCAFKELSRLQQQTTHSQRENIIS